MKINRNCIICSKEFSFSKISRITTARFCSVRCKGEFQKTAYKDENNPKWKGNKAGYDALHDWVKYRLNKASKCAFCPSTENIELANLSGNYKRNLQDWVQLCKKCHFKYDLSRHPRGYTGRLLYG